MLQLKLITKGLDELFASLGKLQTRLKNLKPALREISSLVLMPAIKERFYAERAADGTPWRALKDDTVARRLRGHYGGAHPMLQRDYTLVKSIQERLISSNSIVIGSDVPYAGYLMNGTKNMVARPFIGISAEDLNKSAVVLLRHLNQTL